MNILIFLKRFFVENWLPKLICLVIALGLWSWVAIQQTTEKTYEVPITFTEIPKGKVIAPATRRQVSVRIRGPKTTVGNLSVRDLGVELSLSGFEGEEGVRRIFPWDVKHPPNVEVISIDPGNIRVRLETWEKRRISVRPVLTGDKKVDYNYSFTVSPDTAIVVGPSNDMKKITELPLGEVKWPPPSELPTRRSVEAELPPSFRLEYPPQNNFVLQLEAQRSVSTRKFSAVPLKIYSVPPNRKATVTPEKINIMVKGPTSKIKALTVEDIKLRVEAPAPEEKIAIKKIQVSLPKNIQLVKDPAGLRTVKVRLEGK